MANTGQASPRADGGAQAPTTLGAGSRRPVLFLLSSDDGLLLELGPLLGERYRTRPIESAEQIEPPTTTPWSLIIDATTRTDARAQATSLERRHPLAPLLVICADGTQAEWSGALARGTVAAIVERGALQRTLPTALTVADRLMNSASTQPGAPASAASASPGARPGRAYNLLLVAAIVLALAAGAAWYAYRPGPTGPAGAAGEARHAGNTARPPGAAGPGAPAPNPATAPAGATSAAAAPTAALTAAPPAVPAAAPARPAATVTTVPARTVLELLSDARVAFRDERTQLPYADGAGRGNSAFELYGAVLKQDPQNEEARDGMRRLFAVARGRMQSELAAGKLDDAGRMLNAFRNVGIAPEAIAAVESQIAAARPRWLIAQTRAAIASGDTTTANQLMAQLAAGGGDRTALAELRRAMDAHSAEATLGELAARARAAIAAGALLDPAADSARARVAAMQQLDRNHPLTLAAQRELQGALIARAQSAASAAQFDTARQLLDAAAELGGGAELAAARKQLQDALEAARQRSAAAAAREAQAARAAQLPAAEDFIRAKPLTPLSAPYPPRALADGVHGYVIVEFTLEPKGRASEARVVESDPPKVFDDAALTAVRSGRYDTSALGQPAKSRRARIRISFK